MKRMRKLFQILSTVSFAGILMSHPFVASQVWASESHEESSAALSEDFLIFLSQSVIEQGELITMIDMEWVPETDEELELIQDETTTNTEGGENE